MYDYVIIGGGIIGASTALALIKNNPTKKIILLEKEKIFSYHQTGHNSGVVHSGIYYKPDSLKAKFCRQGLKETLDFCIRYQLPYKQCAKLLVVTSHKEVIVMHKLIERCKQNDIEVELLNKEQLYAIEPNITGLKAILVKATSIVDYKAITTKMIECYQALGGEYLLNTEIMRLHENKDVINVISKEHSFRTKYLVSCAGLMADRVAKMLNIKINFQIIPFRGEYYKLAQHNYTMIKHLIYPIPNLNLPFLGIHLTPTIDGNIIVGPNAVLGFKREGYNRINFSLKDTIETITFKGFSKVIKNNFKSVRLEMLNSLCKRNYLKQVNKYNPKIKLQDLLPYPAGIRAQAVLKNGNLVDDFLFVSSNRSTHVCNAPSPAATSAIPIGKYIGKKVSLAFSNSKL